MFNTWHVRFHSGTSSACSPLTACGWSPCACTHVLHIIRGNGQPPAASYAVPQDTMNKKKKKFNAKREGRVQKKKSIGSQIKHHFVPCHCGIPRFRYNFHNAIWTKKKLRVACMCGESDSLHQHTYNTIRAIVIHQHVRVCLDVMLRIEHFFCDFAWIFFFVLPRLQ